MKKRFTMALLLSVFYMAEAQVKEDLLYWDFTDTIELIPKFRFFYNVLPVSNPMLPSGGLTLGQSVCLDYAPGENIKLTGDYHFQLVSLPEKKYYNVLKMGIAVFPFVSVIKKEFPVQLKTTYLGSDGRYQYYDQQLTFVPINLMRKHGLNLGFGKYNMDHLMDLKGQSLYVEDSAKSFNVRGFYPFGRREFLMMGYKYERSRCYQYRSNEDKRNEKNYLKTVFTNSQVGFDIVRNVTPFRIEHATVVETYGAPTDAYKKQAYATYTKKLNSLGFRMYWEKEIAYWYQKHWGFRFGFEYFQGMISVKGSGMMFMRFGAFGYL